MRHLHDEIRFSLESLRKTSLEEITEAFQLSPQIFLRDAMRVGALGGVLPIRTHGSLFDIAEDGSLALILIARNDAGVIADLVAIPLRDPTAHYLRLGLADVLGEPAVEKARQDCRWRHSEPVVLTIHPRPLDWLRSGCNGAVLLDWNRAQGGVGIT